MLSYTERRNLFGDLSRNDSSENLTLGDTLMNQFDKQIVNDKRWNFRDETATDVTVADQSEYQLPNDIGQLINVTIQNGTTIYSPILISSKQQWDLINQTTTWTADYPQYYYLNKQNGTVDFYPTPSTADLPITFNYYKKYKDLTIADYTTGTITTATNGSKAIVGSGTSWTAKMAGRYIRITDSNTADTGDGFWYEVASVTDATNLTLVKDYQGISISTGSASYELAQVSLIPEQHQMIPVYKALIIYFTSIQPEANQATLYQNLFDDAFRTLIKDQMTKSSDPVISEFDNLVMENPNYNVSSQII